MPSCPSCSRDIGEGATFCGYCGASAGGPGPGTSRDAGTAPPACDYWVCPSCSVENLADDAFCAACGTAKAESPSPAATASPAAAPFAPSASPGAGWRCAACGAVNDLGSSFCWSCGTRAGAVGAGPAVGAAAVGSAAPVAPAGTGHTVRWITIIVAVALIVAAIVLGFVVLRGSDSGGALAGGSTGDSGATQTTDQADSASTEESDGTSTSSAVPRDVTDYCTSSRSARCLRSDNGNTYSADNLIDGSMATCWAEGVSGFGIGETVRFKFSPRMTLTKMEVMPGYKKDQNGWNRWYSNGRLRAITLTFADGSQQSFPFDDSERWQACDFGEQTGSSVQVTIDDVYYPDSGNPRYAEDTSFSEVRFFGWPAAEAGQ